MGRYFPEDQTLSHRFSPYTTRLKWTAVTLLVAAGCVNYLDRSALAVGNPAIRQELHLSFGQMGLLLSAFAWAYGLAQLPAGLLIDRFGPRRSLGAGMLLWSAAQLSAGFAGTLGQFMTARMALGLGELPMYIGGTRVCADWFALKQRALPISIFNSSSALAPALAPPLLTLLMLAFGWRVMFFLAGGAGLTVALAWMLFYRAPEAAAIPAEDMAAIHAEDAAEVEIMGLAQLAWLLKFRTSWGMFLGFFGVVYLSWMYATWLPGYLETQRHLSIAAAGGLSSIPLAAGFLGALSGGYFSAFLGRRMDASAACRVPVILGMIIAGGLTMAGALATDTGLALACMAGGLFAANVASSCGWALAAVVAPNNAVAGLEAVQNVGGSLGGALAPYITGAVVQHSGSFEPAFILAGIVALSSAAFYAFMAGRPVSGPA